MVGLTAIQLCSAVVDKMVYYTTPFYLQSFGSWLPKGFDLKNQNLQNKVLLAGVIKFTKVKFNFGYQKVVDKTSFY